MFSFNTRVSYSSVDKNEYVPLYEIMNYFQDCTTFHSESLGVGKHYMESIGKAWILVSYKIKIYKKIKLGQNISVGTAPTDFRGMFASRQFFIRDEQGENMVLADTVWILMDLKDRKPIRITEEDAAIYKTEPKFGDIKADRKIRFSGEGEQMESFKVLKTYIDSNGHMNNANYLRAAAEFLPDESDWSQMDVVYSREAMEGETIVPFLYKEENGVGINFQSEDGTLLTKIRLSK